MTVPDTADRFAAVRQSLGPTGIWAPPPERFGVDGRDLAASTEKHGFGSLWIGGSHLAPDAFTQLVGLLDASSRLITGSQHLRDRPTYPGRRHPGQGFPAGHPRPGRQPRPAGREARPPTSARTQAMVHYLNEMPPGRPFR